MGDFIPASEMKHFEAVNSIMACLRDFPFAIAVTLSLTDAILIQLYDILSCQAD